MTIAQLVSAVSSALAPLVAAEGGDFRTAESQDEAAFLLNSAPPSWRLVLMWDGYATHPAARDGIGNHRLATIVHQARGLPGRAKAADKLLSFADRLEQVSAWMRALRFVDPPDDSADPRPDCDPAGFALEDSRWLDFAPGARAHLLGWTLPAALPGFSAPIPVTVSA